MSKLWGSLHDDYTTFLTCANKYIIKDGQTDETLTESENAGNVKNFV